MNSVGTGVPGSRLRTHDSGLSSGLKPMKHWKYLRYVARHKWFVLVAGLKTGAPLWRLLIHDWSKFLPCEWFPYVEYFYGEKARLQKEEWDDSRYWPLAQKYYDAFDRAWLHHQHASPHHWQHWILQEDSGAVKILEMPLPLVREMVADWMGAGRAITGQWGARDWYAKNESQIQLHPSTKALVKLLLLSAHDSGLKTQGPAQASGLAT